MKIMFVFVLGLLGFGITANAQGLAVGTSPDNFSLSDLNGHTRAFSDLKGRNGTVIIFLSAQCPAVKAYKDRINQAAPEEHAKGINFIGINSNSNESPASLRSNAATFGYRFPILIDRGNVLADKLDARTPPEVFFFNGENVLLYIAGPSTTTVQAAPSPKTT